MFCSKLNDDDDDKTEKLVLFHVAAKGGISVQIKSMLYETEN